jgi:three-Cys-motif partner protein
MNKPNAKTHLLEHSKAKVTLYGLYLEKYLNILSRVPSVEKIFIFDLMCGEGIYENGEKGSPIIALDKIKEHYSFNNSCPNITIWFNDLGESKLEPGLSKVARVERFKNELKLPKNVDVKFHQEDYAVISPKAINLIESTNKAKGLFFIDPYSYKIIKPEDIKVMLKSGKTEVLLWLPTNFMYRFAESALNSDFSGSEPLREFLLELFGTTPPEFKSKYDFVEKVANQFKVYLKNFGVFVDAFTLESDSKNVYGLFFFTSHIKGHETMVRARWELDENRGKGHTVDKSPTFSEILMSDYPIKLRNYIKDNNPTNHDMYRFGLENGFLPKHTNDILKRWGKERTVQVEIISLDGKPARSSYIEYDSKRRVRFKMTENRS